MNLDDAYQYICSNYPQSRVACDCDCTLAGCLDFFYSERLHWCRCGPPILTRNVICSYLNVISVDEITQKHTAMMKEFGCETIYDNSLLLCLAYVLDAAGITEHGSSVANAWPTEDGEVFRFLLNERGQ